MLKSPLHSSADDLYNYVWPQDERARLHRYMSGEEPLWKPPKAEPPDRSDKDARKAFWAAAVDAWIANGRRQADVRMSLEDIKANQDRFLVQRVLLDSVVAACRAFPTADRVLAVLICDILFAEASSGKYSDVSAERLSHLLLCSERTVRRAREQLDEHKIMVREKRKGLTDKHWPVINPDFAGQDLHPTWWLDATSDAPAPRGKPPKERIGDAGVIRLNPGQVTPLLYDNPGQVTPKPRTGDADEFSTVRYEEKEREGASADAGSPPSQFDHDPKATPPSSEGTLSVASSSPPVQPKPTKANAASDRRGTRLPPDWTLPDGWRDWALSDFNVSAAQVRREADNFRDHWHGVPPAQPNSWKSDWLATWRNWCRREKTFTPRTRPALAPAGQGALLPPDRCRELLKLYPVKHVGDWRRDLHGSRPYEPGCRFPPDFLRDHFPPALLREFQSTGAST